MFIQTEETPNPRVVKFIPGRAVLSASTMEFNSEEEAGCSPLAQQLLHLNPVTSVFYGSDFISITIDAPKKWDEITPTLIEIITDHFADNKPLFVDGDEPVVAPVQEKRHFDDPIEQQIYEIIETRVRPSVAMDGGDIVYAGFEEGVVYLQMKGACSGCPSSTVTLKNGIENMLKHFVPEVQSVEASQI